VRPDGRATTDSREWLALAQSTPKQCPLSQKRTSALVEAGSSSRLQRRDGQRIARGERRSEIVLATLSVSHASQHAIQDGCRGDGQPPGVTSLYGRDVLPSFASKDLT
jgi:hypothetical protein